MLLIFPFEEKLYQNCHIPAAYVGHPLKEMITLSLSREEFFERFELDPNRKLITLLPGSRRGELKYHLPILLQAVKRLSEEVNVQFLLLQAENLDDQVYSDYLSSFSDALKTIKDYKYEAMASSDLVLAACGTANLEAVLLEVPLVSFYKIWPFYYTAGVKLVKIKNYSIANILAEKHIVPELIQKDFTVENLVHEVRRILDTNQEKKDMIQHFKDIKKSLGDLSAFQNAADELRKFVSPD